MGRQWSSCKGRNWQGGQYINENSHDQRYAAEMLSAHQSRQAIGSQCIPKCWEGGQDVSEDSHDLRYTEQMLAVHQIGGYQNGCASGSRCIAEQVYLSGCVYESGLTTADGHSLKTDCLSLADVNGDGKAEAHEVFHAMFMIPPSDESHYETEKGEFLFPEIDPEDSDRSALEVMLRDQVKQLDRKLENVVIKVKNHSLELEDQHARETRDFLTQRAARIAKEAAELGVVLCSDHVESHYAIQKRIVGLTEKIDAFLQEVQRATSDSSQAQSSSEVNQGRFVGRTGIDSDGKGSNRASHGQLQRSRCIPEQVHQSGFVYESGLTTADGHSLKTDFLSLADVNRDGKAEAHEVLHAVFMIPPSDESYYETEKGEFLFPEFKPEDADRSALEVMLRDEVKQLDQKLEHMVTKVKNHRLELEDEHARETHNFLLQKVANIAKEAASLGVVLCSDNVETHRAMRQQIVDLAEDTSTFLQEVQLATSDLSWS